jgi:hypothetical protein
MTRGFVLLLGLIVGFGFARPALAQQVGDPVPTVALVLGNRAVMITTPQCGPGAIPAWWVQQYGGVTILASASPGGPLLGILPIPWPVPDPGPESGWCPGIVVPGAPPGTYYVLMVYGLTNQTSASPSDWQQVVVGTRTCTAPPLPPIPVPGSPVNGHGVTVAFSGTYVGCAIDHIDLELGTTPGASDIGVFTMPGVNTFFPSVPPGTYYARARGVNAYGRSNPSTEIPLRIPGPCGPFSQPSTPTQVQATVNGSQVTIAWTLSSPTSATFHQLTLYDPVAGTEVDNLILPSATSVSASGVPPGTYRVRISSGNACGMRAMVPLGYIDVTVP